MGVGVWGEGWGGGGNLYATDLGMPKVFDNQPTRMPARVPRENGFTIVATVTNTIEYQH